MRPIIYPYKMGSSSAKLLAQALGAKRVRPDGRYKPRNGDLIINWGSSNSPVWNSYLDDLDEFEWLNHPWEIKDASNKLTTFQILKEAGVPTPEWTTDMKVAYDWTKAGDYKVAGFARKQLNGHSGQGIELFYHGTEYSIEGDFFPEAPLYTKDIGKRYEYRVHVFNGEVIDFQKKRRSTDGTRSDDIRSHENGWVFCREGQELPEKCKQVAISSVSALHLSFGAVDVAYRARTDEAFVFEVNTAPGLQGKTLESYVNAIKTLL